MVPAMLTTPVQRMTVPLGTTSVAPAATVQVVNWRLTGIAADQLVVVLTCRAPALPLP